MSKSKQPPAPPTNNACAARGHVEQALGRGVVCLTCKQRKPKRGGWSKACEGDRRIFMGG